MNAADRKKAAIKLCNLRKLNPYDEIMRFRGNVGQAVKRWEMLADEIDRIYEVLQAINDTLEQK